MTVVTGSLTGSVKCPKLVEGEEMDASTVALRGCKDRANPSSVGSENM
jgi:hypothetical protein